MGLGLTIKYESQFGKTKKIHNSHHLFIIVCTNKFICKREKEDHALDERA
jgi:hypothetical protein